MRRSRRSFRSSAPNDFAGEASALRAIAGKALKRTGALNASRIVYVSCNPTTLASDVKILRQEHGYELVRSRPVDMFPHTPHVETVALLTRTA